MNTTELKNLIEDEGRIIIGDKIEKKYLSDSLEREYGYADALIFVKSTKEVQNIIKYANKNLIPITPRGAGTGLTGATIPFHGGIVLDLSKMNKIIEIDEENLTLTVEAGALLKDVQSYVEERDFFYPPDPGEKVSSIGGNVSTNAGGMRAVKYGVTRDYVKEMEIVTGDGKVITIGSKTIKNSTGLDLKNLLVGSEGTLGVITKIVLKILPKPKKSISVLVPFNNLKDGINSVIKLIKASANPTAIEFMERNVVENSEKFLELKLPCNKGETFLLLTFDGELKEIELNSKKAKKALLDSNALDFIILNEEEAINTWKIRGALCSAIEANDESIPIDIVVPITKISDFAEFTSELGKKYNIKLIYFGHAGDGNIHVSVLRNHLKAQIWEKKSHEFLYELYGKSHEFKGIPSGEHGIGLHKKEYFVQVTDKVNIQLMNGIKKVFDKNNILNTGKVYC